MLAFCVALLAQAGIQEAIDALGGRGGLVEIPPGRHVLKRPITVPSGVTLRGAGAVLVKCDGVATPLAQAAKGGDTLLRVKDASGFEPGMAIALARLNEGYAPTDMDAWAFDGIFPVVQAVRGSTLEISPSLDVDFPADGTTVLNFFPAIRVERAKDVVLDSLRIEGNLPKQPAPYANFQAAAIALLRTSNARIRDCVVRDWPGDGISAQGGTDVHVSGCVVERSRGHGFHPGSGLTEGRFLNNRAAGNLFDGLYFCQAVTRTIVDGNLLTGNGRHGIGGLGGGKEEKTRDAFNVVSRNICEGNGEAGIEVGVSRGHRISENVCRGNAVGLLIRGASDLRVSGNLCEIGPKQTKGLVAEGGAGNVFEGNQP